MARREHRYWSYGLSAVTFFGLVVRNVTVKKLRLALTSLAVAIGVVTVVSFGVVTQSLKSTDLALLQVGRADFAVSQKAVSDLLSGTIDASAAAQVQAVSGVGSVTGALIGTTHLNAVNPDFLEIGVAPDDLARFGVTTLAGRVFSAGANNEVMLGWQAAEDLRLTVGQAMRFDGAAFTVVGIYRTGISLGDDGAMLPLAWFQGYQGQAGRYTLLFVQTQPGASIAAVQNRIDDQFPDLTTIRTVAEFGRADRSLSLILAADRGATILAIVIGAVVVLCAMTMSFIERTREFGVLSAIGWSRRRIVTMIVGEGLCIGIIGIGAGLALAVLAVTEIQHLPALIGVLHPDYTPAVLARALSTALATVVLGALIPAGRAARAAPMASLRHE